MWRAVSLSVNCVRFGEQTVEYAWPSLYNRIHITGALARYQSMRADR